MSCFTLPRAGLAFMVAATMQDVIYKICPAAEWQAAREKGFYDGSRDDVRDGFIHFSTRAQVAGTLEKHFAGQRDLVIIGFRARDLGDGLKWETSRKGMTFPHLYARLDTSLAISTQSHEEFSGSV